MTNKISIKSKISNEPKLSTPTQVSIVKGDDEDSKLCRSILFFYLECCKRGDPKIDFGITELANWLVDHHMPFVNEFATSRIPKSYRVHSKRTYIQNRINDLIVRELIYEAGTVKSQKNTALNIPTYSFTEKGALFAWLVQAFYTKDSARSEAIDTVFEIISIVAEFANSYTSNFIAIFFRRCIEKQISHLLDNGNLIYFFHFLDSFAAPRFVSIDLPLYFLGEMRGRAQVQKLFIETIKNLDKKIQRIIISQFKLHIETHYRTRWVTEEWETVRYDNIHVYDKVVISVYCVACESTYPYIMDVFEFLKLYSSIPAISQGPKLDCTKCGRLNTVYIGLRDGAMKPSKTEVMKKVNTIFTKRQ